MYERIFARKLTVFGSFNIMKTLVMFSTKQVNQKVDTNLGLIQRQAALKGL